MRNGHKRGSLTPGEGLGEQVGRDLIECCKEWSKPSQPSLGHRLATHVGTAMWLAFDGCDTSSTSIIETYETIILEKQVVWLFSPTNLMNACHLQDSEPAPASQDWFQDCSLNGSESLYISGKVRNHLVRRARLVTYVSLAVTLAGGVSGIAAALALDR